MRLRQPRFVGAIRRYWPTGRYTPGRWLAMGGLAPTDWADKWGDPPVRKGRKYYPTTLTSSDNLDTMAIRWKLMA